MRTSDFPSLLADSLRSDAARPLVTFYDDSTGERIELSVTTYTNWVNKTAALVQDELDVEPSGLVLVDLPTHWLGAVWLGACWTGGWCVTTDPDLADEAGLVVCGPQGVQRYSEYTADSPVVGISLRPLGARFTDPLPTGVTDYGAVVLAQPDSFVANEPPAATDAAWLTKDATHSQQDVLESVSATPLLAPGGRLLTDVNPCTGQGLATLVSPLLQQGGTVWVAHPENGSWQRKYDEERATAELRAARS